MTESLADDKMAEMDVYVRATMRSRLAHGAGLTYGFKPNPRSRRT